MTYLYGDSTASPLRTNFLEFLRDAMDFGVFVLAADLRIRQGKRDIIHLERAANEEIARLEALGELTVNAIGQAPCGAAESATTRCAAELKRLTDGAVQQAIGGVRANLQKNIAEVNAREQAERRGCLEALGKLLLAHDPWDAVTDRRVTLRGDQPMDMTYTGVTTGVSQTGLAWTMELAVPQGHAFAEPMRLERLAPQIEIAVPEMAGWLKKEVKQKLVRIERMVLTELFFDDEVLRAKLRAEPNSEAGFDLEISTKKGAQRVQMSRTGAKDASLAGPFEVRSEDEATLVGLGEKLRAAAGDMARARLVEATFDEAPAQDTPNLRTLIERLVSEMAPIVREIQKHCLTPNELVIKRLLGNDRREELFVSKVQLRDKLNPLPSEARAVFEPLGLGPSMGGRMVMHTAEANVPPPPPSEPEADTKIFEIPSDVKVQATEKTNGAMHTNGAPTPLAMPITVDVGSSPTVVVDDRASSPGPASSQVMTRADSTRPPAETNGRASTAPSARISATPGPTPSAPPVASASSLPSAPSVPSLSSVPSIATGNGAVIAVPSGGNAELILSIKTIVAQAKRGKTEEAYRAYADLFNSERFGQHRPEDQRQALRLMVLSKQPAPITETVKDAHRAAADRLRALIEQVDHPADYEMLGVCQIILDDTKSASATFSAALEIERKKNPGSELCGNLMRRVASL